MYLSSMWHKLSLDTPKFFECQTEFNDSLLRQVSLHENTQTGASEHCPLSIEWKRKKKAQ